MSHILKAITKQPLRYWPMDTAPFVDYSGYGGNGTASSTLTNGASVAHGSATSSILSNACIATLPTLNVFKQGHEDIPFSLTANVKAVPVSNGTEQQILGNLNQFDGLIINGSVISFVTKYLTTGECRVSYDMQIPRKVNVVGAYGIDRNMLWVDGVLVGETAVTESQKVDKFTTSGLNLYSGACTSNNKIIVNGIGVYSRVLNGSEIEEIDDSSNIYPERDSVPAMYGGAIIDVAQRQNSIFLSQKYDTEELWRSGQLSGVSIRDDALVPTFESNISLPGYWLSTFNLGILDSTSMFGTNINWDGIGVVVEVSINGTTWQTCYQGNNPTITNNINPTDKSLILRVTFPGGITSDTSYLNSLTINGFSTGSLSELNSRSLSFVNPVDINQDYNVNEFRDDWGITLETGYFTVGAGTDDILSVEFWAKIDATGNWSLLDARVAGSTYPVLTSQGLSNATILSVNGQSRTPSQALNLPLGTWNLIHASGFTNPINNSFQVNKDYFGFATGVKTHVGRIVTYGKALTQTEMSNIYNSYVGQNMVRTSDNSVIGITEPAESALIYAHNWTIVGSG